MCLTPITIRNEIKGEVTVPCSRCPQCLNRRASGWAFRLMRQEMDAKTALFITLTYAPANLTRTAKRFRTLVKKDYQNFMKRLRKYHHENSINYGAIKYYACGEYGSTNQRPHYHAILFNSTPDAVQNAWTLNNAPIGAVYFGTVTGASVGYVLKYMSKEKTVPRHRNDDRIPEFSLMSKRMGGAYLTPEMIRWHHADLKNRMYVNIQGKKISMPRYYKDKIYTSEQREEIAYHQAQVLTEKLIEDQQLWINEFGTLTGPSGRPLWEEKKREWIEYKFKTHASGALKNRDKYHDTLY